MESCCVAYAWGQESSTSNRAANLHKHWRGRKASVMRAKDRKVEERKFHLPTPSTPLLEGNTSFLFCGIHKARFFSAGNSEILPLTPPKGGRLGYMVEKSELLWECPQLYMSITSPRLLHFWPTHYKVGGGTNNRGAMLWEYHPPSIAHVPHPETLQTTLFRSIHGFSSGEYKVLVQ